MHTAWAGCSHPWHHTALPSLHAAERGRIPLPVQAVLFLITLSSQLLVNGKQGYDSPSPNPSPDLLPACVCRLRILHWGSMDWFLWFIWNLGEQETHLTPNHLGNRSHNPESCEPFIRNIYGQVWEKMKSICWPRLGQVEISLKP